jgi:hypothetical protein
MYTNSVEPNNFINSQKTLKWWVENYDKFTLSIREKLSRDSYQNELDRPCNSIEEAITCFYYIAKIADLYDDCIFWQGVREGLETQKKKNYLDINENPIYPKPNKNLYPTWPITPIYPKPNKNLYPTWPRPDDIIC